MLTPLNKLLNLLGIGLVKVESDPARKRIMTMIFLRETLADAKKMNLGITDYIEITRDIVGHTKLEVNKMNELGLFEGNPVILEIGAGTGRYIDHFLKLKKPFKDYIVYEQAKDWALWLEETYKITRRENEGYTLKQDTDNSVDVLFAHGVFVYVTFLNSIRYYHEMIRTTKPGGKIVFDLFTEKCFNDETLTKWLNGGRDYPVVTPYDFLVDFFAKNGCKKTNDFFMPIGDGVTQYFVFEKQ